MSISCRLLDQTPEISRIGTLLHSGQFRNSEFVFWEEGYGSQQQFPIAASILDIMIRDSHFEGMKVLVPLWSTDATVHAVLRLENGEEYPLSGFPRALNGLPAVAYSKF